jgi:small subunit ribosomal protein S18
MANQNNSPIKKTRACFFCANKIADIDYKDTQLLRRFLSSFAKIVPRKRSGVCMSHQRELANAIKRARVMALVPFVQN